MKRLAEIRRRLGNGFPVRLVQPNSSRPAWTFIFRSSTGIGGSRFDHPGGWALDREGKITAAARKAAGRVVIFETPQLPPAGFIRNAAASAAECSPETRLTRYRLIRSNRISERITEACRLDGRETILDCWPDLSRRAAHLPPEEAARETLLGFSSAPARMRSSS